MSLSHQFSLALKAMQELAPELREANDLVRLPLLPSLEEILNDLGPLPIGTLLFGIASDGFPLLLNLYDPSPGPIMVIGDSGSGKTAFLKAIARVSDLIHDPGDLQFCVITNFPDEWDQFASMSNNAGVWPIYHQSSRDFLHNLTSWADRCRSDRQFILLLIDGIDAIFQSDFESNVKLKWLLRHGPCKSVWPLVTLNTARACQKTQWQSLFKTRIFGHISQTRKITELTEENHIDLSNLYPGNQFKLNRSGQWLEFWIPAPFEGERS